MMELIKAVLLTLDIEFIDMGYGLWSLGEPDRKSTRLNSSH